MKKFINFAVCCLWVLGTIGGIGYASGDRYLADKYARYLSPWQRHWQRTQRPDVVATDTNIHRQYSDICHDNTVDNINP